MARRKRMVEKHADRTVWRLPRRFGQAGGAKQLLVVIGVLFGAVFVFAGYRTLVDGSQDPDSAGGLAMTVGALLVCAAILAWLSQARIELTADGICGVERLGPFDLRRCADRSTVNRLVVSRPIVVNRAHYDGAMSTLELCSPSGVVRIARRYRRHLLRDVAEQMADELGFQLVRDEDTEVEFRAADYEPPALTEEQRASRATVENVDGVLVLTVPRDGFKRASGNLMLAAVMGVLFPAGMAWACQVFATDLAWVWRFPAAIACVGAIVFWIVLVLALRSTKFRIEQGALSIHRIGAFYGEKVVEVDAGAVSDVLLIDRDGRYAGETVKQLQIKARWKSQRMFKGRDEGELQWIVTTLRAGLGLDPPDQKVEGRSE